MSEDVPPTPTPPADDFVPNDPPPHNAVAFLAHADRCWKAEEANATRLATRANLVLTAVSAIIGLKLYAIGREVGTVLDAPAGAKPTLFWVFALFSAGLLLSALGTVLGIRRWDLGLADRPKNDSSASDGLAFEGFVLEDPMTVPAEALTWLAGINTYEAASDLQARNGRRKIDVDNAQRRLLWGILLLAVSMLMYVWIDYDSRRNGGAIHAGTDVQPVQRYEGPSRLQGVDGIQSRPHRGQSRGPGRPPDDVQKPRHPR